MKPIATKTTAVNVTPDVTQLPASCEGSLTIFLLLLRLCFLTPLAANRIVERERRRGDSMERVPRLGSRTNTTSTIQEDQNGEQLFEPYTDSPTAGDDEATPKVPHVNFALSESPANS
jgi:hypothetical protein